MSANPKTLEYLRQAVETLVTRGAFTNNRKFRPTQSDALSAYHNYLNRDDLRPEEKLKGFFEIPTGVGKTAVFLAVLDEAHRLARADNEKLRVMIVVPTIPILEQMQSEIEEWSPDYLGTVGFYGGKHRKMGEELTVITYNSWVTMMEEGKIDSSNIDILISDEAHRGTSERRLNNQFNAFAAGTAQLAFTATARFDEEKSVEQSHGYQIFSRGVGDSVRLGELAAYIQTQLYVIRVQPLPPINVFNDASEEDPEYEAAKRAGMKQEAWMQQMVAVLRDGRDAHTGDALTDNKSGFYVFGTAMAERFAAIASADPVLQQRAKDKGCKDVVVAIHSNMRPSEQDRRMKAFLRGDYLGVSSDTQLKEGFNDKELKNVFDYPRSSLVDKAQIIGRAARQWWNPIKNRNEGATIIDSIVYIGTNDTIEDKRIRAASIRNAIMAWSVLDGTAVFTEKKEPQGDNMPPRSTDGGRISPVYGLDVDSFINLDDLKAIYAEQRQLQGENRIEITEEMRIELNGLMTQKGVGSFVLIKEENLKNLPQHIIESWKSGNTKTADKEVWERVINSLRELPDAAPQDVIRITEEMRQDLNDLMVKKGVGAVSLTKAASLEDIKPHLIQSWKSSCSSADKKIWERVLNSLRELPDAAPQDVIRITEEMRQDLNDLMVKKGVGAVSLTKAASLEDIKPGTINSWRYGLSKTGKKEVWETMMVALKGLPDTLEITHEMRQGLNTLMIQKCVSSADLIKAGNLENLKAATISAWKSGASKTAEKEAWEIVMTTLKSLPDKTVKEIIDITNEMREGLNTLMAKKGVGAVSFTKAADLEDIKSNTINSWKTGHSKSADKDAWERVISALKALPNATMKESITISFEMRESLNNLMAQRAVGSKVLVKCNGLEDIKAGTIDNWKSGGTKTADKEVWERVMSALRELPLAASKETSKPPKNEQPKPVGMG